MARFTRFTFGFIVALLFLIILPSSIVPPELGPISDMKYRVNGFISNISDSLFSGSVPTSCSDEEDCVRKIRQTDERLERIKLDIADVEHDLALLELKRVVGTVKPSQGIRENRELNEKIEELSEKYAEVLHAKRALEQCRGGPLVTMPGGETIPPPSGKAQCETPD